MLLDAEKEKVVVSQNRTLEGPLYDTGSAPDQHRTNTVAKPWKNRAKTGAVWGVQDTREQVGFAGLKGK